MVAASFDLTWEALVAIVVVALVVGILGMILLSRNPREHHFRVGFFVERGAEQTSEDVWPDPEQTVELPPKEAK